MLNLSLYIIALKNLVAFLQNDSDLPKSFFLFVLDFTGHSRIFHFDIDELNK